MILEQRTTLNPHGLYGVGELRALFQAPVHSAAMVVDVGANPVTIEGNEAVRPLGDRVVVPAAEGIVGMP